MATTSLQSNWKKKYRTRTLSKAQGGTVCTMAVSTTFIEVSRPLPAPVYSAHQDLDFNDDRKIWSTRHIEEHPFVETIRMGVLQYRLQSASHFDVSIEVHQTRSSEYAGKPIQLIPSFKIEVLFHDFNNQKLYRICRLKPRRSSRKVHKVLAAHIQVREYDRNVSLHDFLNVNFPILQDPVKAETLHAWWSENGKTFNWIGLPTELKERIIQSCMHRTHEPGNGHRSLQYPRKRDRRRSGPHELTDILGTWSQLLRVSHQVRAITLRLCFVGSSNMTFSKGLCVVVHSCFDFKDSIRRLGKYYQVLEPNSVPVDDKSLTLAKTYKRFPKLFPELKQYATLMHGIRRVCLQMGFLDYLHFFKITAGGFEQYWRSYYVDYEAFEQLPHLSELLIILPDPRGRLEDKSTQHGPPLFYEDFACPRILHRFIYEQAAVVLAPYENVKMYGFIDELEKLRFNALRQNAIKMLKFTGPELYELYAEDGGGIKLEERVIPGVQIQEREEISVDFQQLDATHPNFWPPKCRCAVRCREVLLEDQYNI
ncbi:uncharacterized protein K460DRAFT_170891 [Cucurbitaria berberidis CBS 394.84]|uniref:Uncharacterized protein n=1 Tax=Cucurbitaria berberidis CBS 394.84 TaxID=1168544 RepID=A0A9P4G9J3_9PLEO|nr:uncharacterized protein K460DRAFT_170891 [Cucurbitaria berberidis CBS 394.84]KAF1841653.1 hypothetical protein K460DRAFT_170891 [Cucurbitaria berberidis CBS 394.84]